METKDYWKIALILLAIELLAPVFLLAVGLPLIVVLQPITLDFSSAAIIPAILFILLIAGIPLFYLKKKQGYYLALSLSTLFSIISLAELLLTGFAYFTGNIQEGPAANVFLGALLAIALTLIINLPLAFTTWKSKQVFEEKK